MEIEKYEYLNCMFTPAYLYIEGDEHEKYWVDSQNLYYHTSNLMDDKTELIDNKNWWIIEPLKIKGTKVTEENHKELIKHFVTDSSIESDVDKEWNFTEHKPINN